MIVSEFPNLNSLGLVDCDINAEHLRAVFPEHSSTGSEQSTVVLSRLTSLKVVTNGLHPTLRSDVHQGLPPFLSLQTLKHVCLDSVVIQVAPELFQKMGSHVQFLQVDGELWFGGRRRAVCALDWCVGNGGLKKLKIGQYVYEVACWLDDG